MKVVAVLHTLEQLRFGLQDLRVLRGMIAAYDRRFGTAETGHVVLIATGIGLVLLAILCIARGGRARLAALITLSLPRSAKGIA